MSGVIWILVMFGGYNSNTATVIEKFEVEAECIATMQQMTGKFWYGKAICISAKRGK